MPHKIYNQNVEFNEREAVRSSSPTDIQESWTEPEDSPYAKDETIEKMGGWFDRIFIAGFADGHVSNVSESIEEKVLRATFTKAGGEFLDK